MHRFLPRLSIALVALALVAIQLLIGGVRMVFSIPPYILLAVGGLAAAVAIQRQARPPIVCAVSALLLCGWVVVRALTSPVAYLARPDLLMVLAAALLYFLVVMCYRGQRTRLFFAGLLLVIALANAVIGAVQFKQADNFMLLPGIMRPPIYEWRASGFYICPNHLAGFLEITGLLALSLAFWSECRPLWRVVAAYCALMCVTGVALTGSRGGYLSVVAGLSAFGVLSLWAVWLTRRGGFALTLAAILAGVSLIVGGGILFMSKSMAMQDRLSRVYEPGNMRVLLWKAALKQYHLQPLTGTGSGTYLYFGRQFRSPDVQNDPMHAHNDYLELLAEYGIVGVAVCGIFVLSHLCTGLVALKRIVPDQIRPGTPSLSHDLALNIGALSGIAALLVHSVVDFNLHIPANALLVALLFGFLASPVTESSVSGEIAVKPAGLWRWLPITLAVTLLGLSLRFLPGEILGEKARVALRDDRNNDALDFARRGLAWETRNPYLYEYLGKAQHFLTLTAPDAQSVQNLHQEAAASYAAALKLFPQDTGMLLEQAQIFDLLGRFSEAEEDFQLLFRSDPLFGNVYAYYGLHWQLQRRLLTAERCFRLANRLLESEISPRALRNIEQTKNDPLGQSLMSAFPDIDIDLPAERILPKP